MSDRRFAHWVAMHSPMWMPLCILELFRPLPWQTRLSYSLNHLLDGRRWMAAKDRYGNGLRRGQTVKDLSDDNKGYGEITATITNIRGRVMVRWEGNATEHSHRSSDLVKA